MAHKTTIKAGYRVTFHSTENDGDSPNVITREGVSEREARFLGALAHAVAGSDIANNYEPDEDEQAEAYQEFLPIFERFEDLFSAKEMEQFRADDWRVFSYISEHISGSNSEGYVIRSVGPFTIEFIPQDIVIDDVTEDFRGYSEYRVES
jgi:hypothetical protein